MCVCEQIPHVKRSEGITNGKKILYLQEKEKENKNKNSKLQREQGKKHKSTIKRQQSNDDFTCLALKSSQAKQ